jgi:hypothetical protein
VAYPYPPPQVAHGNPQGSYVAPPPPIGYPTKGDPSNSQHTPPAETTTRGEGFWKGWQVFYHLLIYLSNTNIVLFTCLLLILQCCCLVLLLGLGVVRLLIDNIN